MLTDWKSNRTEMRAFEQRWEGSRQSSLYFPEIPTLGLSLMKNLSHNVWVFPPVLTVITHNPICLYESSISASSTQQSCHITGDKFCDVPGVLGGHFVFLCFALLCLRQGFSMDAWLAWSSLLCRPAWPRTLRGQAASASQGLRTWAPTTYLFFF